MFILKTKPKVRFTVKIANIPIEVHVLYPQTKWFCRDYLTDELPLVSVSVCKADIHAERKRSAAQRKREGRVWVYYSNKYLETLALCRKIAASLLPYHIVLFHGAVMALDGRAYLFTAKSGTGKTTHCKLWLKNIPHCYILNGDKPFLLFKNNRVYACGSPWMGKENYGVNEILPLEAICLLERDSVNYVKEVSLKDNFEALMKQCHIPQGKGNMAAAVGLMTQFSSVKLYCLKCNKEDQVAAVAYKTLVSDSLQ